MSRHPNTNLRISYFEDIRDFKKVQIYFTFTIFMIFASFYVVFKKLEHKLNEPNEGSSRYISLR